jgi:probable phosphoglycerate mutase
MRHGKTEWNSKHKLQGRTDIPLSDDGRKMAVNAGEKYADVHFDICYCSPLIRAKETAELVLKGRSVPIITDERLTEMGFGIYEGIENSLDIPDCPINVLFNNPEKYLIPVEGAESLSDVYSRTGEFINEVVEPLLKQGKDILIIGHGAMNSCIVCQVKGLPVEKLWSVGIENCKLMKLI